MTRGGAENDESRTGRQRQAIQYVEFTRLQGRSATIFDRLPVSGQPSRRVYFRPYMGLSVSVRFCHAWRTWGAKGVSMKWKRVAPVLVLVLACALCGVATVPLFAQAVQTATLTGTAK